MITTPFRRARTSLSLVLVAGLATFQGCSSGGGTTSVTPVITVTLTPASASVAQGGNVSIAVSGTGSGSFSGAVTFTATSLPNGVTSAFSNQQTSGATTTATLLLSVGSAVPAGSYTITVTGSGTGATSGSKSFTLTVTATTAGGYTLSALPTTVVLAQGASANTTITIARTGGFAGSVSLSATGMGSGLTPTFNPASTTGNTSTLTLAATAGAATGTVTLTITGTATGLSNQTTTIQVTVNASGGSGNVTVDYSGCAAGFKPIWFAAQDGNGPWTRVTGTADVYHFTVSSGKGGFAVVTPSGANFTTTVFLRTQAELTGSPFVLCGVGTGTKSVSVTVAGIGAGQFANLAIGGGNNFALANGPVTISNVLNGPQDFVGYRTPPTGGPLATDRAVIIRDLNVTSGSSIGTADFGGASAIVPATATVNVAGAVAGDAIVATMAYLTGANCTSAALYAIPSSANTALNVFGIPAASQRATDFHNVSVFARNGSTITRTLVQAFHTLANLTVTLGAVPTAPVITNLAQAGYKRLQAAATVSTTDYPTSVAFFYTQQGTTTSVQILATQAYIGGQSVTLAFPDFSAVTGWTNSWAPAPGSTVDWTFLANDVNYTTQCVEGARLRAAQVTGVN